MAVSVEKSGDTMIVTLLDTGAAIEDVEISWDEKSDKMFIRQQRGDANADVVVLSSNQAYNLLRTLEYAVVQH